MGNMRRAAGFEMARERRFEPAFYRWADHAENRPIRPAERQEIAEILAVARQGMTLAEDAVIDAVRAIDPAQFQITEASAAGARQLIAFLRLNEAGTAAMLDGRFSGAQPDLAWLARPGEIAASIYIWLVWAPQQIGQCMRLVAHMEEQAADGLPVFSRAVTAVSARMQNAVGFQPASDLYPSAPPWLLVALPMVKLRRPSIKVQVARTMEDIARVFAVRSAVYMAEQFPLYEEEFDGNDFCATHLLATVNGDVAGCLRIRWFGDFAKVERMAVRKEYRRYHVTRPLAAAAIAHCRRKGYRKLYAHSRADLVPLWASLGWRDMGRKDFSFADIPYREIMLELEPLDNAICFGADPMLLLRPEGGWDELGPFDRTQLGGDRGRLGMIHEFAGLKTSERTRCAR
ncbi:GNAT family N-acetyltransferase [Sphingomonas abietis]|uniref:GNAT family N-acetyltransferase n=1 Tax=Sphingomonas abietis TaxID=3012344 RepID=A0ABY7NKK6_9SPHN|nr:GNAT family N-acetyltransferase [Sphingomonas abietis]WBO21500.1 GNAT family N-acetyltransferase [Sphingomonas abietis]